MKQKTYYTELESLRGIAALMIVFEHVDYWCVFKGNTFVPNLYLFVDFFFVLSGFVIAYNFSESLTDGRSYKNYLLKRFFRLYPLFLATSIPYFVTSVLKTYYHFSMFQQTNYFKVTDFLYYISLTFKWGFVDDLIFNQPTWSISVELLLYIISGLMFMTIKNKKVKIIISGILCLGSFCLLFRHDHALINSGRLSAFRGIFSFFMGVIIAFVFNPAKNTATSKRNDFKGVAYLVLTTGLLTSAFLLINPYPVLTFIFPLLWAMLIYFFISHKLPEILTRLLNTKFMLFLGVVSYSIYLNNPILTFVTEKIFKKERMETNYLISIGGTATLIFLVIIVSKFTYQYIERPGKSLYKRFGS